MESVKVTLTEKHWNEAQRHRSPSGGCSANLCLVSQALMEKFSKSYSVTTGIRTCTVDDTRFDLDSEGQKLVWLFDINKKPKLPIEIKLTKRECT